MWKLWILSIEDSHMILLAVLERVLQILSTDIIYIYIYIYSAPRLGLFKSLASEKEDSDSDIMTKEEEEKWNLYSKVRRCIHRNSTPVFIHRILEIKKSINEEEINESDDESGDTNSENSSKVTKAIQNMEIKGSTKSGQIKLEPTIVTINNVSDNEESKIDINVVNEIEKS